ncbi:outer membrane protein/peptidoglycan-associated (lipo)protein [Pseudomonas sp. GM78]|uniref:OmpA family protein n=1 Tax=Pseudomonas sp. GM78 TaxID=1144337 RepID=UPI000270826C|nr:OmpA family protein [Pseudomonas sp. GM78]EJN27374.1 outer membrane protein/peptidoglycan-associated (lipo)protein [Pseudomonas sp. GM78]
MTALFEMRIRLGSDPTAFSEFKVLREELARLSHPACPDVDWATVEQLCLALFQRNGAELQTAAAFALARSQLHGLEGMAQGIALIEALVCEWATLWPAMEPARLEILAWLFARLQSLLRSLELQFWRLPAIAQLSAGLERLHTRLDRQVQHPPGALQTLRQQVDSLLHRLAQPHAQTHALFDAVALSTRLPPPPQVMPVVILPTPPLPEVLAQKKAHRLSPWLFAAVATITLATGAFWTAWLASPEKDGANRLASVFQAPPALPQPVRLDSLSLFTPGSAELKPGSTKVLISALVDIKAQPDWLIVIAGHSDAKGSAEQNLQLSHARASAVRGWMQRMGDIPDSCFAVQGFADSQPIASNDSEAGRAANRRVDIQLVPQTGACGKPSERAAS